MYCISTTEALSVLYLLVSWVKTTKTLHETELCIHPYNKSTLDTL